MALTDSAVLKPGAVYYFVAEVGTDAPLDLKNPETPWTNIGHTSLEDIASFSSEGGEATTLGTAQAPNLRVAYSPRSEALAINLQQFDEESLKLYYGSNSVTVASNGHDLLGVPQAPTPTEKAFLAIFVDGENIFGYWAPKASIFRGEDVEISDFESLASLPLAVTPVVHEGATWAYAVLPIQPYVAPEEDEGEA